MPGEHVIAHGTTTDGRYAVASSHALYLPVGDGFHRLGWERVARAVWRQEVLRVTEAGEPGSSTPVHEVPLADPGQLTDAVHDRVTSTIVMSHHVPLQGKAGVRFIARRRPGSEEVLWSVAFDQGIDATDPAVRERATRELEDLRRQTGL